MSKVLTQIHAFFLRKDSNGGFISVTEYSSAPIKKLNFNKIIAFILGLNSNLIQNWIDIADNKKLHDNLKRILKQNNKILGDIVLDKGYLQSEIVVLEDKVNNKHRELKNFNILPTYRELEDKANLLTKEINTITENNFFINKDIRELNKIINDESRSNIRYSVEELYNESRVNLPENIYKTYEDLEKFHKSIVENRKRHLSSELSELESSLQDNNLLITEKSTEKQSIMKVLNSKGALDQFSKLQNQYNEMKSELNTLTSSLEALDELELNDSQTKEKLSSLKNQIESNLVEQKEIISKSILSIHYTLEYLYGNEHVENFSITTDPKHALKIELTRPDGKSSGINKMLIFSFDLMLMEINRSLNRVYDFMFHDSHLFDGVDSRQIELALKLVNEKCNKFNFQYIVTLNSDIYSLLDYNFDDYKVDLKLTDKTDTGGLLGLRI